MTQGLRSKMLSRTQKSQKNWVESKKFMFGIYSNDHENGCLKLFEVREHSQKGQRSPARSKKNISFS